MSLSRTPQSKHTWFYSKYGDIKRRYCVIVYVHHFWSSNCSLASVRSFLYMPNSLFFTLIICLRLPLCWQLMWVGIRRLSTFVATESAQNA